MNNMGFNNILFTIQLYYQTILMDILDNKYIKSVYVAVCGCVWCARVYTSV